MLLEDFIRSSGIKKKAFAQFIGISTTNLWKLLKGLNKPSLKTAQKIQEFTNNQVTIKELLSGKPSDRVEQTDSLGHRLNALEEKVTKLEKTISKPTKP
ncbi:helix-turn-helix domain-containing protein [Candidatus Neptunochlamydia vexilliferae]|uniref:HTH cro/C1-type domain-containing protein n=1 Tax=Candidatus Neptunichlamydia vexilliferae TaxID=1651774 RepID=A0ABS0AWY3_9BACT|nr:helix-turn-helix transcriptional regulator [Candidatus Neptunochlamydia vexilliferae]MBF5058651.1 hypothetical protein [Candidatus Neptunochlamydia vexilliferae]